MDTEICKVLVQTDDAGCVTAINSDAFVSGDGWTQIDEGAGDRYHHAQGNYFPGPLYDARGIPRYVYVPDGNPKWRERTQEEMDADYVLPTNPPKTNEELQKENEFLKAQVQALSDRGEFIEDCIAEMAMVIYQ